MRLRAAVVAVALVFLGTSSVLHEYAQAQRSSNTLQAEIAQVEREVDVNEATALTRAGRLTPGDPQAMATLGKVLFYDKNLSFNRNTACAFCHIPQTGYQGALEIVNRNGVDQPGSVRTRYSLRKPPSAAYAAFSPPCIIARARKTWLADSSGTSVRLDCAWVTPPRRKPKARRQSDRDGQSRAGVRRAAHRTAPLSGLL
jgi:cytochrome c peroxidase